MPLGHDWSAMNTLIDQMAPLGETNLTIGLAYGWQALSTGPPLNAPGLPPNTIQAIVFMTDGFNTANRWNNVRFGAAPPPLSTPASPWSAPISKQPA